MGYRVKRTDHNQQEIMDAIRARYGRHSVWDLHEAGGGLPDLLMAKPDSTMVLIECKQPGKKLNEKEQKFFDEFPGRKIIAYSGEDALEKLEE